MNSINWPASSVWVFIAQLGEHCSANAEATGSNPVEAPKIFFSGYFRNCLNCDSLRWSHTHFKHNYRNLKCNLQLSGKNIAYRRVAWNFHRSLISQIQVSDFTAGNKFQWISGKRTKTRTVMTSLWAFSWLDARYMYLLRVLIGSLRCLCLLWLVRVITLVSFGLWHWKLLWQWEFCQYYPL